MSEGQGNKLHGPKIKGVLNFNTVFCISVNQRNCKSKGVHYVMEKAKLLIVEGLMFNETP